MKRQEKEKTSKSRVLLVDDHPIVRQGLAELINGESDLAVCGECDTVPRGMRDAKRFKPDLLVVDLSLQDGNSGLELIKQLRRDDVRLPILVLSMHEEALFAERALRAGASGYIMKREESQVLLHAIRTVLAGEVYVSDSMKRRLLQQASRRQRSNGNTAGLGSLSDRELEVFRMLGEGHSTSDIARRLQVAVTTVETHRAHLKQKLHLKTAGELRRAAALWLHTG